MNSIKNAEAIFFDLDDTLYDSLLPFQNALEYYQVGLPRSNAEEFYKKVRHYSDLLWKEHVKGELSLEELRIQRLTRSFLDYQLSITDDQALAIQERYEQEQQQIKPFETVHLLLKQLVETKPLVGIITNGPVNHQMNKLKALKIDQFIPIEHIFISDGIGMAKPDNRVFEHVHTKMNIDPGKCLYIGDTWENDIVPPIEVGWKCIWFNHRNRQPQTKHVPNEIIMNEKEFLLFDEKQGFN
ncbi:HAD family hydrolase [Metabacillus litoralis]|uniref:HAD family hydrolase n=1 Tax=Metabacillus litoralis TaxID=152268 RepID=UPI001BA01FEB|nr:HAD family hydrolase [Metabacillus litoralis]UHA59698.1 HAD family hydrolase [Metabacillus litoralis]